MKVLIVVLVLLAACAAFVTLKTRALSGASDTPWPFYAKKLLSQPEQVLYHRLVAAMPECMVLAQIQLSQVVGVKKGYNFHEWSNRINRMSLDFLVCLKDSTIVAAIELDDKTHERASRLDADAKKQRALSAAGVALVRWNVSALPDETAIRQALAK